MNENCWFEAKAEPLIHKYLCYAEPTRHEIIISKFSRFILVMHFYAVAILREEYDIGREFCSTGNSRNITITFHVLYPTSQFEDLTVFTQ